MKTILTILIAIFWQVSFGQKTVTFPNINSIVDTASMQLRAGNHKIIIKYGVNRKYSYDTVSVTILADSTRYHINQLPYANAGDDITAVYGKTVTLSGGGYDADGVIAAWKWSKISGPTAGRISYPTRKTTTFTGAAKGTHVIMLTVTDNHGGQARDTLNVMIR